MFVNAADFTLKKKRKKKIFSITCDLERINLRKALTADV